MQEAIFNGPSWMYQSCWMAMNQAMAFTTQTWMTRILKRQPKLSAHWYSHFLKSKGVSSDGFVNLKKNLTALSHDHFSQYILSFIDAYLHDGLRGGASVFCFLEVYFLPDC